MVFEIERLEDSPHSWAVAECSCNLADLEDELLSTVAQAIRDSYGESDILGLAAPDPGVEQRFDLSAITAAFRMGLPDPSQEGRKPEQLTNYRSETTEVIARLGLAEAHHIEFPSNPQIGKPNANQPILGFDGWGFLRLGDGRIAFILVQVKATDSPECPPAEAAKLAVECTRVPRGVPSLCRALSILAVRLEGELLDTVLAMMQEIGSGALPLIGVAPVVVRGVSSGCHDDLQPVYAACADFAPAFARGLVISVGADLSAVGVEAMNRARAA
jgi:hypothetical protein